jgi:2-keto-4-pentenoate hydratase
VPRTPLDADRQSAYEAAAARLVDAARQRRPCRPVRELLPDGGLDDGYEVQKLVHASGSARRRRVGRKIGLTSLAVQRQMQVHHPDFGVLFADMAYGDSQPIPSGDLLQPRVEAEVAFVLGADLPERDVTAPELLRAVDFVLPAIEVVDSRIAAWDISIFDTVADNASSGVFVTGGAPRSLRDIDDLRAIEMTLTVDRQDGDDGAVVSSGTGAACLGHPLNAVLWLANTVARHGEPLRAGELVLSGSLGPLVDVVPGSTYHAHMTGLGSVRATFTADG